jgi:hypothetical protein
MRTLTLVAVSLLLAGSAFADPLATPASAVALIPSEKAWLTPLEANSYDTRMKSGDAAAIASAVTDARAGVSMNLPADARKKYAKLTTGKIDEIRLNTLLYNVINLTPSEVADLEQKHPADLKKYQAAIAALQGPDHTIPMDKRDDAHKIVLQYRAMTAGPAAPPHKGKGGPATTHPRQAPPTGAPTQGLAVPLTGRETAWLTDAEASEYAAALKAPGLKASDRLVLLKKYRDALAQNDLPLEFRDGYKSVLAANADAAKIDANLLTIVELSPSEVADLEKIVKGKEPAGLTLTKDNARLEYEGEMAPLPKENGHTTAKECHHAYTITAKYRGILKAAGSKAKPDPTAPTTGGTTGPARLSDKELGTLTGDERKSYEADLAAAIASKDPAAIAAVNQKYRRLAATRDIDVFTNLDPDVKKDLCAPYKNYIAGSGTPAGTAPSACDPTLIDISKCKQPGKQPDRACIAELTKQCQTAHPQTPTPPSSALPPLDSKVQAACAAINNSMTLPTGGSGGPVVGDVPSPGSHPGTDKDPKPADKKGFFDSMSKEMASNIKAGVAGAVFGLLLGSFFGPVGMLVGAAIGGGAFFGGNMVANKLP